ncbi:MAG: hypothetical protein IEMM0008_0650 [bacterium]|nr:MAG: hypothetical protein IEMM0008_0650 [bacterium]
MSKSILLQSIFLITCSMTMNACKDADHKDLEKASEYYKQATEYRKESKYQKALEIRERVLGGKHPATDKGYNGIGIIYCKQRLYEKALSYYIRTLKVYEKGFGGKLF